MKTAESKIAATPRLGIVALVAAALTIIACSTRSKPEAVSAAPSAAKVRPAVLRMTEPATPVMDASAKVGSTSKPSGSKMVTYRSRDYGVAFTYPWQYAFISARNIADRDPVLHSKSDGTDGPFTLARIEIPKGYYPDTNFDSGYFSVSLNQAVENEECVSSLGAADQRKTDTINGVDYRYVESDSMGGGHSLRTRRYAAFRNATCYQFEVGVTTSNDAGLAREIDPEKVLGRLDAILRSVTIVEEKLKSAETLQTSAAAEPRLPE